MESWLVLIFVGVIIYILTFAPIFPSAWQKVAQMLAGFLVLAGILILVLALFGIDLVDRAGAQELTPTPMPVVEVESGPASWGPADWALALTTILGSLTTFYFVVGRPLLQQIKELIVALRQNTASTDTSAAALNTTAVAVDRNTDVTNAVAQALPAAAPSTTTVNVSAGAVEQPVAPA